MRQSMVTRTITTTKCVVLCIDTEKKETSEKEFIIPRTYKNDKAMLKQIEKTNDNAALKPVHIVSSIEVETLYGMSEQDFIANAAVLPPRTANTESEETKKSVNTGKN